MTKFTQVKGTKDLFNKEYDIHEKIVSTAKSLSEFYGYQSIITPIIEHTDIYKRTLGEASDVVNKEMYSFQDKGGDEITLRPEFTAGVVRAFITNGLQHQVPLRFFSYGPLFRHERPQAGRQRQFHQLNFEHLGAVGAFTDAEIIKLGADLLENLGILEDTTLQLNSLGCKVSRANFKNLLVIYFHEYKDQLSQDSLKRLMVNPLRILDSKDEGDQEILKSAPKIYESYTDESKKYFDEVLKFLDLFKIKYTINDRLVRGLDYYSHTAFEFTTTKIGAQSAIIAGGRYDDLVPMLGGPAMPSIGFAAGVERIALVRDNYIPKVRPIFVNILEDKCYPYAIDIINELRAASIITILETEGKLAKRIQKAVDKNACAVIFIGNEELESKKVKIKQLDNGFEELVNKQSVVDYLKHLL